MLSQSSVCAHNRLCPHTCTSPLCTSPASLSFLFNLVGSIPRAGLSLQALASDMPSGLQVSHYLFSSDSFPPPSPPFFLTSTEGKHFKVEHIQSICLCCNFEISSIYLNKVNHNWGIITMDFLFITLVIKNQFLL